ncbi:MAG TPA: hypothetical protein VEA37_00730, partial [Flavobacterium sp.]|nr:hypothetical protein [Flavobacterium sp.]
MRKLLFTLLSLFSLTAFAQQPVNRDNINGQQVNVFYGTIEANSVKVPDESNVRVWPTRDSLGLLRMKNGKIEYHNRYNWVTTNQNINNSPYDYPDWWEGIRTPVTIKNGSALYKYDVSSNFDLSSYTPYYISPTGNNSNDGLTQATPKATVLNAISAGAELIYMMPGTYLRDKFIGPDLSLSGNDLLIIGIGEVNVTNGQGSLSWTLTTSNTYEATRNGVTQVFDKKFKSKYGYFYPLKQVFSQADCESESGTYFTDNVKVWVHTLDDRSPDTDIIVDLSLNNTILSNDGRLYLENLNIYGMELYIRGTNSSTTLEIYCKDVFIPVPKKSPITATTEFNSFRFDRFKVAELQNCGGIASTQDIFNYHNTDLMPVCNALELECTAFNAGINSSATNNQCSSAHEGVKILRINGNYYGGNTQVIADVNDDTGSVLIGCELNTGNEQANTVIFYGANADIFGC